MFFLLFKNPSTVLNCNFYWIVRWMYICRVGWSVGVSFVRSLLRWAELGCAVLGNEDIDGDGLYSYGNKLANIHKLR